MQSDRRSVRTGFLFVVVVLAAVGIGLLSVRAGAGSSSAPLAASVADASSILFKEDFETALDKTIWGAQAINPQAITISSDVSRTGSHAVKFTFDFADWSDDPALQPQGHRVEIAARSASTSPAGNFQLDKTYWVGFSGYVPSSWPQDPRTGIIWQFHGYGSNDDAEDKPNGPGIGNSPPLSASVIPNTDTIGIFIRKDGGDGTGIQEKIAEVPLIKGAWSDWAIQVRFAYSDGLINIWRNGDRIAAYAGSTIYHSQDQTSERGPYLKLGIYKPNWGDGGPSGQVPNLTLYYDALTVADDRGTCGDVLPPGAELCEGVAPPITPDTTAPRITLLGANPLTLTQGEVFTDPGATATDAVDGDVSFKISAAGSVDADTPGTYTVTYRVSDAAGNSASATRTVVVRAAAASCTIESFVSDEAIVTAGDSTTLSWETDACDSIAIDSIGSVAASGVRTITPSETTRYTLRADSETDRVTVTVVSPEAAPVYVVPDTPATITTQTNQPFTVPVSKTIQFTVTQRALAAPVTHVAPTAPSAAATTVASIEYALDGAAVHRTEAFPDTWTLDTLVLANDWHTLVATYRYQDGTERQNISFFKVENPVSPFVRARQFFLRAWNGLREFFAGRFGSRA